MGAHHIIRDRLRQELARRGLTATELAKSAGVKTSFIYDILNGKSTNPSTVKLAQVAETLGVGLTYLAGLSNRAGASDMAGGAIADDLASIPRLKVRASAGGGTLETSDEEDGHYYFRRSWIRDTLKTTPETLRMLHITGDSMVPTLCDNDIILVDTQQKSPSPPGVFVLFDGLGLVAKRLELVSNAKPAQIRILSDNAQYGAYERSLEETQIIGRVVWFAREL